MNRIGSAPGRVFVDTSAFFALASSKEATHLRARSVERELRRSRSQLVCTNYVVAETHALVLGRVSHRIALDYLRRFQTNEFAVVRADDETEEAARQIIERYTDKDFSLADAVSFVVMEMLGISTAFTFDENFRVYGFTTL